MPTLLIFEFPWNGPWDADMTAALQEMARDIATEEGLLWKVWTQARERAAAGGVYLFVDAICARRYLEKHTARLRQWGIDAVDMRVFDVNAHLSAITHVQVAAETK